MSKLLANHSIFLCNYNLSFNSPIIIYLVISSMYRIFNYIYSINYLGRQFIQFSHSIVF